MTEPISLREYLESRLAAHEALHAEHTLSHDREHKATEVAIAKAESATSMALGRAEEVINARFAQTNEWRGAFSDRERSFLTKVEYQGAHDALIARLDKLEDAEIARVTRESERERAATRQMALIGLAAAVGGFVMSLLVRLLGIGV